MNTLKLTEEQAKLVRESLIQIAVVDQNGEFLGFFNLPLTPERTAELKRRAREGPFVSSEEMHTYLDAKFGKLEIASSNQTL